MSVARSARPVKPKSAVVKPKAAAAKPKAVAPVVAPEPVVVKPEPVDSLVSESDQPLHKSRVQTNKVIGVNISAARVRRHIDKLNLNRLLDELIAELDVPLTGDRTVRAKVGRASPRTDPIVGTTLGVLM